MNDIIAIGSWLFGLAALVGTVMFMARDLSPRSKKK
jgi:hypothetical protein